MGRKQTEQTKEKIRIKAIGRKHSEETKRKMSLFRKGNKFNLGKHHTEESKKKISLGHIGIKKSEETKKRMSKAVKLQHKINPNYAMRGKHFTEESINKIKEKKMGDRNAAWLGGKSFEPYTIDFNEKFKWKIRKRDNQICMLCRIHREKLIMALDIHHINYDKELSIPENCISLCRKCHVITNLNREKWISFFQSLLSEKYNYKYKDNTPIINI
jgi:hypothetical protein